MVEAVLQAAPVAKHWDSQQQQQQHAILQLAYLSAIVTIMGKEMVYVCPSSSALYIECLVWKQCAQGGPDYRTVSKSGSTAGTCFTAGTIDHTLPLCGSVCPLCEQGLRM